MWAVYIVGALVAVLLVSAALQTLWPRPSRDEGITVEPAPSRRQRPSKAVEDEAVAMSEALTAFEETAERLGMKRASAAPQASDGAEHESAAGDSPASSNPPA